MSAETASEIDQTFEIGPSFGIEDAARLHAVIERAAPGARVAIDFHRMRDCHGAALAVLARTVAAAPGRVALRGMSKHQRRLLGYLGVSSDLALEP